MIWNNNNIDLGVLKEHTIIKFSFRSPEELDIIKVEAGCSSCTKVGKYKDKELPVSFSTGSIPKHLKHLGEYEYIISKSITITYASGDTQKLMFNATIKN